MFHMTSGILLGQESRGFGLLIKSIPLFSDATGCFAAVMATRAQQKPKVSDSA